MGGTSALSRIIAALRTRYGTLTMPVVDPFEMILFENAAYLVDDAKRVDTFGRLRAEIGVSPKAILARSAEEIAAAIADGGMRPLMRAEKVLDCARIATAQTLAKLRKAIAGDTTQAKKMLREYPGVGEPYADKILLFSGASTNVAPDSNVLRVLVRLGFGTEQKNYAASYRSALAATAGAFSDAEEAQQAHLLLRRHGQELCKRSAPRCDRCPARAMCQYASGLNAPARRREPRARA
jgi:endonuclease III